MRKILLFSIFNFQFSIFNFQFAQNLVPNPSFDIIKGKVKEKGQIQIATGWISATLDNADLFSKNSKISDFGIPENNYGKELTDDGENYAGIVAQGLKNAVARTYLQTQLTHELQAEKEYCVQFFISLSDLSKFACNDIGAYISNKEITSVEILKYDDAIQPQILNSKNKIYDNQDTWEPVCGIYKAGGGEKFITIGNFEKGTDAELKKMMRPKGFTKPQVNFAYYYVENVSVIPLDEVQNCICEKQEKKETMEVVVKKNTTTIVKETVSVDEIKNKKIYFDIKSAGILASSLKDVDAVAKIMNENPDIKIKIIGYSHAEEKESADLATLPEERAKNVFNYLISKGINENRMSVIGTNDSLSEDNAQNRKVEFVIIK